MYHLENKKTPAFLHKYQIKLAELTSLVGHHHHSGAGPGPLRVEDLERDQVLGVRLQPGDDVSETGRGMNIRPNRQKYRQTTEIDGKTVRQTDRKTES